MLTVTFNTQSKPIFNISQIFSGFVCPMDRVSGCANLPALFTFGWLSKNSFNPLVKGSILYLIALPVMACFFSWLRLSYVCFSHTLSIFRIFPNIFDSFAYTFFDILRHIQTSFAHCFYNIRRHFFAFVPRCSRTPKATTSFFMCWRRIAFFKFGWRVIALDKFTLYISIFHKFIISIHRLFVHQNIQRTIKENT